MRIAVLSDTHGQLDSTQAALDIIRKQEIDLIVHCGDIGSQELIELFADWPTHFVFGNVDNDREDFKNAIETAGQYAHGTFGELTLLETRIAFLHGDDAARLRGTISSQEWNLVCYGHTHKMETHTEGLTVVLNPGALYRARIRTFAIVELPSLAITFQPVP